MSQRFRRGSDATRSDYTFRSGEPIYVSDTTSMWIGDGATAGGIRVGPFEASTVTVGAGIGLAGTSNISSTFTLSVDIDGLTEDLDPASDDFLMSYDTSATTLKKVSVSSLLEEVKAQTLTLTNKTIDADNNTVTNIGSTEIKAEMITGQSSAAAFASGDKFLIVSGGALD